MFFQVRADRLVHLRRLQYESFVNLFCIQSFGSWNRSSEENEFFWSSHLQVPWYCETISSIIVNPWPCRTWDSFFVVWCVKISLEFLLFCIYTINIFARKSVVSEINRSVCEGSHRWQASIALSNRFEKRLVIVKSEKYESKCSGRIIRNRHWIFDWSAMTFFSWSNVFNKAFLQ